MKHTSDHEEFMAMLKRCERTVFKVCYMMSDRSRQEVMDLYQDIVSNLWLGYSHFRRASAERTWVYRVALNTALGHARRHRHAPPTAALDEATYLALEDDARSECLDRLYHLIDRLEPREKELVFLYLDGLSQQEMADITKCSARTIRNRMKQITQKLIEMNQHEE